MMSLGAHSSCVGVQGRRKPLDGQHMVYQELDGEEEGPERERSGQILANHGRLRQRMRLGRATRSPCSLGCTLLCSLL